MNPSHLRHNLLNSGILLTLMSVLTSLPVRAADSNPATIIIKLGDYQFLPDQVELVAGEPARLVLINTDDITPHNFTLKDKASGLDLDVDVAAGKTLEVELVPQTAGTYRFFCNKKLLFMKSHRDRGMQGSLSVTAAQ
jgi:uncharacterized cupredoxin-like copper-binding protein